MQDCNVEGVNPKSAEQQALRRSGRELATAKRMAAGVKKIIFAHHKKKRIASTV
ncbi:hypothetical protein [Selenomonas ruminantium]|uniref:hypothetical protein n=1 Tax=Selenomonas ruminantium TaxID=971 RepID=UPI001B7FE5BB|nr:hypothetical protein [Selenomonas ruminantium]